MGILLACMYVYHVHAGPTEPEEDTGFPETELQTVVAVVWKWGAMARNQ